MVKTPLAQKIEDLEKKNLGYWILVEITKRNRYREGTHGHLLFKDKYGLRE